MKKGLFTKELSLLLCLLMLVSVFASCNKNNDTQQETDGTEPVSTTAPSDESNINDILASDDYKVVVTEGVTDYVIVYPAGADTEKAVAESLKAKLEADTGAVIEVKDDTAAEAEKEILIGNTNRTADDTLFNGVKINDYVVKASGDKLLVGAYTVDCYEMAWKRALIALNVTEADGKYYAYFEADYSYQRNGDYTVSDLTVDGNSISKYVIVYGDDLEKTVADSVQLMIQEICGYILPVRKSNLASEAAEFEIIVGDATNRAVAQLETTNTYEFKSIGKSLLFYFTNDGSGKKAVSDYGDALEALVADGTTEIKTLSVTGAISNANAGEVLFSQNFDSVTGTTTDEVLASAGIEVLYTNVWSFADGKYAAASNGGLKLNGGWTKYKLLSPTSLVGVDAYTIQMDVTFDYQSSFGNFNVLFGGTAAETKDAETGRSGIQIRNLPNNSSTDQSQGTDVQYMGVRILKDDGAGAQLYNSGVKLTETNKLVIEIDKTAGTINVYVNGTLLISETNHTVETGNICLRMQNTAVTVDNFIVSNGTYVDYQSAQN